MWQYELLQCLPKKKKKKNISRHLALAWWMIQVHCDIFNYSIYLKLKNMEEINDVQALEKISSEVDESQIKVILSSQCIKGKIKIGRYLHKD